MACEDLVLFENDQFGVRVTVDVDRPYPQYSTCRSGFWTIHANTAFLNNHFVLSRQDCTLLPIHTSVEFVYQYATEHFVAGLIHHSYRDLAVALMTIYGGQISSGNIHLELVTRAAARMHTPSGPLYLFYDTAAAAEFATLSGSALL